MTVCRWSFLVVGCLAWHCAGTPQTDPPEFNPGLTTATKSKDPVRGQNAKIAINGAAGAVQPGGAIVHIVNLDNQTPEVTVVAGPDGAFGAIILAAEGSVIRFQVQAGSERTAAVDLVYEQGGLHPLVHSLTCLTTSPESHLVVAPLASSPVELRNDCDVPVSVAARVRITPSAFSVREAPSVVQPHSTAGMVIETTASSGGEENVLFLELSSPDTGRRAITLIGNNR